MVVVECQAELLEVVAALCLAAPIPGPAVRRQEDGDEDCNDGDHDEQFDEGETSVVGTPGSGRPARQGGQKRETWRAVLSGPGGSARGKAPMSTMTLRTCPPRMSSGRNIAWQSRQAVFWLASQTVPDAFPLNDVSSGILSGDLLAYSGGPAGFTPASCPIQGSNAQRG